MIIQVSDVAELKVPGKTFEEALELGGERRVDHAKRKRDLGNNCLALSRLLDNYRKISSVTDFFAGLGLWASVVEARLTPKKLRLFDYDRACVKHLKRTFRRAFVCRADSYQLMTVQKNFSTLNLFDFTKCTWKTVRESGWASRLFAGSKDLLISDCAGAKIHLNYRVYGVREPDYRTYLKEYAKWLYANYGYSCVEAVTCGGASRPNSGYLLLRKKRTTGKFNIIQINVPEALVTQ